MKSQKLFLLGIWMASSLAAAQNNHPEQTKIEAVTAPAIYKSEEGPTQRVLIRISHEGRPETAILRLGDRKQKVRLSTGKNAFHFEIPEVKSATELPLTVTIGKKSTTRQTVKISPVRHWQMNLVQHTHTDIGYTRSQMEILAEHLRYIDYALDYCDATDNYPGMRQSSVGHVKSHGPSTNI